MPNSTCPIRSSASTSTPRTPGPPAKAISRGTWPTVWYHTLDVPASKTFVANFIKKNGKPPENHAWIEYVSLKMMAQAMNETKSTDTDKLIAYFEKETQFDILKARKAYFRVVGSSADAGSLSVHAEAKGPGQG